MKNKPILIGVGGFARAGKDTFVKVARKILTENGYSSEKLAFADALKNEIGPFIKEFYGIDVWTDNTEEKTLIRPLLVAHGCQKRIQTNGKYWVDKVDEQIEKIAGVRDMKKHVIFISDCRFPNEVTWAHERWGGWFVHLKKYRHSTRYDVCLPNDDHNLNFPDYPSDELQSVIRDHNQLEKDCELKIVPVEHRWFDEAPNDEEAKNDPICEKNSDYNLELENVIQREQRINGIKITTDDLIDNTYLLTEIKLCLTKCPFLTIK